MELLFLLTIKKLEDFEFYFLITSLISLKKSFIMKKLIMFLGILLICLNVNAQVITQSTENRFIDNLLKLDKIPDVQSIIVRDLSNFETMELEIEDEERESYGSPWRFATLIETDISINNVGSLELVDDHLIWIVRIQTNSAKSISITFKDLKLSEGAEIYLFTDTKKVLYGPLTKDMFVPTDEISTEVLAGNSVYVYYRIQETKGFEDNVHISKIGYGYRYGGEAFNEAGLIGDRALSCHVDVTGTNGDCFRMEQRAVARTLVNNSTAKCTATLINNTNSQNNMRPFLITANHCSFTGPPFNSPVLNFANLGVRFFDYTGTDYVLTYIGATERVATGQISDCSLLELNQRPNANHGLFYLGWDRTTTPPNTSIVLHHPGGEKMKISGDINSSISNPTPITFSGITFPSLSFWRFNSGDDITAGDFGAIEGGSSGSALINPAHRIIGDLTGGQPQTCIGGHGSDTNKWFGRFDVSYNPPGVPIGNANLRLENWLNPSFNNVQNLNATFELTGSSTNRIPCPYLRQNLFAPLLKESGGTTYSYIWRSSSNITISGAGHSVLWYANGSCIGCSAWVECDIRTTTSCGYQLVATSIRRNFSWGSPNDAILKNTISPPTNNNGIILGAYNTICAYGTYSIQGGLTGIPLPSNVQLQWSATGPITLISGNQGCGFTTNSPGFATITCTVINGTGCLAGQSANYTFEILHPCSSPLINGSAIEHELLPRLLSKQNTTDEHIKLYPNPATNNVLLELPMDFDLESGVVKLFNLNGIESKKIYPKSFFEEIDVKDFPSGVYFISISDKSINFIKKLIIN